MATPSGDTPGRGSPGVTRRPAPARRRVWLALLLVVCLDAAPAPSAHAAGACASGWVGAWAGVPSDASAGTDIADIFAPSGEPGPGNAKQPVVDSTVRAILTPTLGGTTVRVHLSNRFGAVPVTFAHSTIAKQASGAALSGSPVALSYAGQPGVTVSPGQDVISDPVAFSYEAFENLAVSAYVSGDAGKPTEHYTARQTSYFTPVRGGDRAADTSGAAFTFHNSTRPFVTGLDVRAGAGTRAVVAFGDSITDGYQGQPAGVPETAEGLDANGRWPDVLARRLRAANVPLSVVNAGISGNRVLLDGGVGNSNRDTNGPAALKRLEPDVLGQAGVTTVIWLEGINDLGQDPAASPGEIIAGYQQGIAAMHAAGLRVLMGTLTPSGGASGTESSYGTAQVDAARQQINAWIRTNHAADGFIDFDAAVRDPSDATRINPAYDGGDHLHFNLAGYERMGETVDLARLQVAGCAAAGPGAGVGPGASRGAALKLTLSPRSATLGHRVRVHFRVTARVNARTVAVRSATIKLAGHTVRTNAHGTASIIVRFSTAGTRRATAAAPGYRPTTTTLHVRSAPSRAHPPPRFTG